MIPVMLLPSMDVGPVEVLLPKADAGVVVTVPGVGRTRTVVELVDTI